MRSARVKDEIGDPRMHKWEKYKRNALLCELIFPREDVDSFAVTQVQEVRVLDRYGDSWSCSPGIPRYRASGEY
jgi:hypothetical protein